MKPKMFFPLKLALFAFLMALCPAAWAQSSVVTITNDSGPGSLRGVISNATNNEIITFDPSLSGQTIVLTNGQINIFTNCKIDASSLSGGVTVSGNHSSGIFNIGNGVTAVFNSLTFTNGRAVAGGAIYSEYGNATMMNCMFFGNNASFAGGAISCLYGTLNSTNCSFIGNSCTPSLNGGGGAIFVEFTSTVNLTGCTFAGNSTISDKGGGAVYSAYTGVNLTDCTFAGNFATNGNGGALFLDYDYDSGMSSLLNCTITGNSVTNGSGAGIYTTASLALTNCILTGNAPDDLVLDPAYGPIVFTGANNLTNGNPMLSALGNHGGPTQTMLPLTGSPALDAGNDTAVAGLATDQRGFPRISGAHVDIGAAEFQNPVVTTTADSGPGSLRAVVGDADTGGSITFAPNLSGKTILLTNGQINLLNNCTIDASALPNRISLNGNQNSRFFEVKNGANVMLNFLFFTNCYDRTGGAILVDSNCALMLNGCSLQGNSALPSGGPIPGGGAIYNNGGFLTLTNCMLVNNSDYYGGGAIYDLKGSLTLMSCTLSGNSVPGGTGGAILGQNDSVALANCAVVNNFANYAAGAIEVSGGSLTLVNCSFTNNSSTADGGAIYYGNSKLTNHLNVVDCTFFGNSASGGDFSDDKYGGAIGINATSGKTSLSNCTFYGNSVNSTRGSALGGAIYNSSSAVISVLNCTVIGNSVNGSGAGIYNAGMLALTNCIVVGNAPDNINGSFTGINNFTNGNPMLSPLGNYGGLMQTVLPLPGSPVIDAGNDAAVAGLATDARGFPRLSGAHVDIGAVEFQAPIVTNTADSGPGSLRAAVTGYLDPGATITFAPNLSGQTILLTSGQLTLAGGPILTPEGNIYSYGNLTLDASALPGGLQINGNHASRIFYVPYYGLISLKSLTLTNGNADNGGAIDVELGQLNLLNCSLVGNTASLGGAIYNNDGGVVLNQSTLSGNSAPNNGGAIYNAYDGNMSLNECTLFGNSAANGTGGAIYNGVANNAFSSLSLNQCTVSGNAAAASSAGGIFNDDADGEVTSLINSIVSSNTPVNFAGSFSGTPNLVGGNAHLAALGNYGGPTQTMPPLPGSPAIDAAVSSAFTTDQRGYPRTLGLAPDLGAVEGIYVTNLPGKLTGMTRLGNGSTQFTFTNLSDASSTILASTNLTLPVSAWPAAGYAIESPAGSGQFQFTDPQATNYPQRYYRVKSP